MQPPDSEKPQSTRRLTDWFRIVRLLALGSVLAITVPSYIVILRDPAFAKPDLLIPVYYLPLWGPYVWIFLRMNSGAEILIRKRALALAISWATLGLLLFFLAVALQVF